MCLLIFAYRCSIGQRFARMKGSRVESLKTVVVIGQGYVGLPAAVRATEVGYNVVGIDSNADRVGSLEMGSSYIEDVSDDRLQASLRSGRYRATLDYGFAKGFDFAIITVPTPLREGVPDLSFIEGAAVALAEYVTRGCTVVLESTTYPGTTQELLTPLLEAGSGLTAGLEFFVGYSPERIDPGNPDWGFVETPKVVAGINPASLKHVQSLYQTLVATTVAVSTPKEAELAKLLENTFRHVNIALVNEMAVFAHQLGVDLWESINAAATKPFGFMKFTPGPGVGGHCLPVDPSYFSWQVRRQLGQNFRFIELANDINDHMPNYVVQRAAALLNLQRKSVSGSKILLLGLAYKKNTKDIREAPSLQVISILVEQGATVCAVDEHVLDSVWPAGATKVRLSAEMLAEQDLVILITDHDDFDYQLLSESEVCALDTRHRIVGSRVEHL
jgi:UDP-N-acetyl-D-glucosamine dehydrogenase